jgi:hypothetical protein
MTTNTNNNTDEFIMLDDYKIYIQHELLKINNRIDEIGTVKVVESPEFKNFGKFKNDFYGFINRFYKIQKNMNAQFNDIDEKNENTQKLLTSLKNKVYNDNIMYMKYTNVNSMITIVISVFASVLINKIF